MKQRELETEQPAVPGKRIEEELKLRGPGWTQRRLSGELGLSHAYVSHLTTGRRPITAPIAVRLERVLGLSAEYWLSLQSDHDLALARLESSDLPLGHEPVVGRWTVHVRYRDRWRRMSTHVQEARAAERARNWAYGLEVFHPNETRVIDPEGRTVLRLDQLSPQPKENP